MNDLPSVMRPRMDDKGRPIRNSKGDIAYPGIIPEMVLFDSDRSFLLDKYLRRGRLVDACANIVAMGGTIDPEWFLGHSGEAEDDRVEHAEVLPYLDGVREFLAEHDFKLNHFQLEVTHKTLNYVGHLDWIGVNRNGVEYLIDIKCGKPPGRWKATSPNSGIPCENPLWVAYHRQTACYAMAYGQPYMKRAGLHLYDGKYQLVPHDDIRDIAESTIMVQSFHDRERFRSKVREVA
jgi:hypothetical protein